MPAILKRDSENQLPANAAAGVPELKKVKSSESSAFARTSDVLGAWGAGRFNAEDAGAVYAALAEFFSEDCVVDVSSAAHSGVPAHKVHHGLAGVKDWFDFSAGFAYEGTEMSHVEGSAPNEVWMRFSCTAVCTATGKSAPFHGVNVFTWEGGKATRLAVMIYNPATVAAICSEEDVPIPSTVQLPSFEPHPSDGLMELYGEKMALWGAGEFSKPEGRSEHFAADIVDDMTDPALPDVLKAYTGLDETGELLRHIENTWEISNMDTAAVAGLAPGCVMIRLTFDVKHKTTGKEAKGVRTYLEAAYNADRKISFVRRYWANAPLLASIY